jgi:hypothetical protein
LHGFRSFASGSKVEQPGMLVWQASKAWMLTVLIFLLAEGLLLPGSFFF